MSFKKCYPNPLAPTWITCSYFIVMFSISCLLQCSFYFLIRAFSCVSRQATKYQSKVFVCVNMLAKMSSETESPVQGEDGLDGVFMEDEISGLFRGLTRRSFKM